MCERGQRPTAALNTMLSGLPLAVAKELNPSAIDEQVQRPIGTTIGDLDGQRPLPSAQGRIILHRPVQVRQLQQAGDHAGRLP